MRTRSPPRRTLPSTTRSTPSRAPISASSTARPLNAKDDVRAATRRPGRPVSVWMSSSVMPSLKYSSSGSPLVFANGSTAMPVRWGAAGERVERAGSSSRASTSLMSASRRATSFSRQAATRSRRAAGVPAGNASSAGASATIAASLSTTDVAGKGFEPVSISKRMHPKAQTSVRASSARPRVCSGLM